MAARLQDEAAGLGGIGEGGGNAVGQGDHGGLAQVGGGALHRAVYCLPLGPGAAAAVGVADVREVTPPPGQRGYELACATVLHHPLQPRVLQVTGIAGEGDRNAKACFLRKGGPARHFSAVSNAP